MDFRIEDWVVKEVCKIFEGFKDRMSNLAAVHHY